jgi:putative ABC transport system permease protein
LDNLFALITVFTSCLGLCGLVSKMAERRRKEIGIRKTLGTSEAKICSEKLRAEYIGEK